MLEFDQTLSLSGFAWHALLVLSNLRYLKISLVLRRSHDITMHNGNQSQIHTHIHTCNKKTTHRASSLHEAFYLMPFSFDVLNWKRIRTAWWCTRIVAAAVEQILVRFSRLHSLNSIFFCHVIHKGHRVTRPLPASLLEAQCHMTRGRWARRIRCDLVARGTLA